jgi:hypothetical protein
MLGGVVVDLHHQGSIVDFAAASSSRFVYLGLPLRLMQWSS